MNLERPASIVRNEMPNRSFISTEPFSLIIASDFAGVSNHDPCGTNAKPSREARP